MSNELLPGSRRVRHCEGSLAAAELARSVAALPADTIPGSRLVVIDGCAVACTRRSLEAAGRAPVAVTMEELGADPDQAVSPRETRDAAIGLLQARTGATKPAARTRRPAPAADVSASRPHGHSTEDYLYAINLLTSPVAACGALVTDAPTVSAQIARALSVSRASAGEMLQRLRASGLIVRSPARDVLLTPAGRAAAHAVVHRHRLVERFLVDHLGCTAAESFAFALEMREGLPDRFVERLELVVDGEARCPHGWPLDPRQDHEFAAGLAALSTIEVGSASSVEALVEGDAEVLGVLFGHGIEPGAEIEVLTHAGPGTMVAVRSTTCVLPEDGAAAVLIRSASLPSS
jgi:DtxR family Mn-dependent transcriptional regulator